MSEADMLNRAIRTPADNEGEEGEGGRVEEEMGVEVEGKGGEKRAWRSERAKEHKGTRKGESVCFLTFRFSLFDGRLGLGGR
jgi:hypothetical protein